MEGERLEGSRAAKAPDFVLERHVFELSPGIFNYSSTELCIRCCIRFPFDDPSTHYLGRFLKERGVECSKNTVPCVL